MVEHVPQEGFKQVNTMNKPSNKRDRLRRKSTSIRVRLEPWRKALMARKMITAEIIRKFIKDYGKDPDMPENSIRSGDWRSLLKILNASPALQVMGQIGSGKSFLLKKLISKDLSHIFVVIDSHHEYSELPVIKRISHDLTESSRILPPKQADAARGVFQMYKNVIMAKPFPKNYVVLIEESSRYAAKQIMMESRKFVKTICVSQEKAWNFCPYVNVWPYNKVDVKKILRGGDKK